MILNFIATKYQKLSGDVISHKKSDNLSASTGNIIVREANELLYLITLLRQQKIEAIADNSFTSILQKVDNFIKALSKYNLSAEQVDQAKYLICASIDEAHVSSNANLTGERVNKSLISYFYKEGLGGEKFFNILEILYNDIPKNLALIKFAYLLLGLGFQGKYGINENGGNILKEIRDKLYLVIAQYTEAASLGFDDNKSHDSKDSWVLKLKISIFYMIIILSTYTVFTNILIHKRQQIEQLVTQIYLLP